MFQNTYKTILYLYQKNAKGDIKKNILYSICIIILKKGRNTNEE